MVTNSQKLQKDYLVSSSLSVSAHEINPLFSHFKLLENQFIPQANHVQQMCLIGHMFSVKNRQKLVKVTAPGMGPNVQEYSSFNNIPVLLTSGALWNFETI